MDALEIPFVAMDRRIRWACLWAALATGAAMVGCSSPLQAMRLGRRAILLGPIGGAATSSQPTTAPCAYDDSAWQQLLLKHVAPGWTTQPDPQTQQFATPPYPELVAYREILEHPADLNACLAMLARTGPATAPQDFPSPADQLAYYLNAYNACAVRAALADYPSDTVYTPMKPAFEQEWYFQMDGRRVNLDDLRQKAQEAARGDARFLFALTCASVSSPPLASHPYKAADLNDELDAQAKLCLSMPEFLVISHDREQLQLWWRIVRGAGALSTWYEGVYGSKPATLLNVVMDLARPSQRESLNKAVGYKIVEVPFDRRLNDLVVRASAATAK